MRLIRWLIVAALAMGAMLQVDAQTVARGWEVDIERSRVGFIASYDSIEISGQFKRWRGQVRFDPRVPHGGHLVVDVDMASVDTASRDRDVGISSEEWFNSAKFGQARYKSQSITALTGNTFRVVAEFDIKGRRYPLISTFRWLPSADGYTRLQGAVTVDRRTFSIGSGEWASDPIIGFEVKIEYDLYLRPQP